MNKVKIADIANIIMGQSPSSDSYNQEGKGVPFFQGKADFGRINPIIRTWCDAPIRMAEEGDILISVRAPVGDLNIADINCCIGRGLAVIRPKLNMVMTKYLYYSMKYAKPMLENQSTGSTFKAINKDVLKNLEIKLCSLAEQNECVKQMSLIESLIEGKQVQIKLYENLVKSRFIEMFADTPKGVLSDVATIKMGQSPDGKTYNDEGNGTAFYQGKTEFGDLYIGAPTTWTTAPTRFAEANDVLMSVRAPVGSTNIAVEQCCLGRGLAGIRPIEGKSTTMFILYSMRSIENQIEGMGVGSTFKAINKDQVYKLPIPIADLDKQARFVKIAEQSDKSKFEIQQSIEKLEILKKSLMQEYFG